MSERPPGRPATRSVADLIPAGLRAQPGWGESWDAWLRRLPALLGTLLDEWDLTVDGAGMYGKCSLVLPVREEAGRTAVLKVAWPHDEADQEHLMMSTLDGDGMAMLYRADPRRHALLMERLYPERDLSSLPVTSACEVAAGLYARLHQPAPARLRSVSSFMTDWVAVVAALPRDAPLPRRLVEQALSLAPELLAAEATSGGGRGSVMVHGDLHYANVLAADREPWLAIDPKPMAGTAEFEPVPLLFGRWAEALATGNAGREVRRRFERVVDVAGLDEERAKAWAVFRMVRSAARVAAGPGSPGDHDYLTRCITIAKALSG